MGIISTEKKPRFEMLLIYESVIYAIMRGRKIMDFWFSSCTMGWSRHFLYFSSVQSALPFVCIMTQIKPHNRKIELAYHRFHLHNASLSYPAKDRIVQLMSQDRVDFHR